MANSWQAVYLAEGSIVRVNDKVWGRVAINKEHIVKVLVVGDDNKRYWFNKHSLVELLMTNHELAAQYLSDRRKELEKDTGVEND